jgi:hypothetical protein
MYLNTKAVACLGVALASWLLPMPASAADEVFSITSIINVPNKPLQSFDISFVDPVAGVYLLADRLNGIDVVDTATNKVISQLQPKFAGIVVVGSSACPTQAPPLRPANCSGPNGVLSFTKLGDDEEEGSKARTQVWVGDGFSRVWALDLKTGAPIGGSPISTALPSNPKDPNRADELCYDPDHGIILVANPSSNPDFVTFISTRNYKVLGWIVMNGTLGGLNTHGGETPPIAAGGIEQCQYSQRTGKFYLNVPQATIPGSPPKTKQDLVLQIDPVSMAIKNTVNLTTPPTVCTGLTGMAVGPDHQLAIACGQPNSVVISEDFSGDKTLFVYPLPGESADEMWYNPGDNHYFFANSGHLTGGTTVPPAVRTPQLGVVDAFGDNPPSSVPQEDASVASALGSHSVAADPVANQVYVPVNNLTTGTSAGALSKICSTHKDANGKFGVDTQGCIAIYTTTNDDKGVCGGDDSEEVPGCPPSKENEGDNSQGNDNG